MKKTWMVIGMACGLALPAMAQSHDEHMVIQTVEAFHSALSSGDSLAALALLAEDASILESGGVETRAEYRSGHLVADIRGAGSRAPRERSPFTVVIEGDVAWATSSSTSTREVDGQTIRSSMAETMVLTRTNEGWTIRSIHWSSRRR